jgi:hypothetical protein
MESRSHFTAGVPGWKEGVSYPLGWTTGYDGALVQPTPAVV